MTAVSRTKESLEAPPAARIEGLLQTVGGAAAPIVHALAKLKPRFVVFVCSEDSQATVEEVKRQVRAASLDGAAPRFQTIRTRDPADLVSCFRAVADGLAALRESGLAVADIRLDFTGGTKAMSAAAVLAAAPDGYRFAYVGGQQRNKDGLGTVVDGAEELVLQENPWTILEEPEIRHLLDMASRGQWAAALESAGRLMQRATEQSRPIFDRLRALLEGLREWDRFAHVRAFDAWKKGKVPDELAELAVVGQRRLLAGLAIKCQAMKERLGKLAYPKSDKASSGQQDPLVLDMLANAERQRLSGDFDAAALRYYRAIELWAGRRLKSHTIDNSAVREDQVPEPLRDEFRRRNGAPEPAWKLGLVSSVQLLSALGDTLAGQLYAKLMSEKRTLDIDIRNRCWLIHGAGHVEESRLHAFREDLLEGLGLSEADLPCWPNFSAGA